MIKILKFILNFLLNGNNNHESSGNDKPPVPPIKRVQDNYEFNGISSGTEKK